MCQMHSTEGGWAAVLLSSCRLLICVLRLVSRRLNHISAVKIEQLCYFCQIIVLLAFFY